jgi:class 3 adenylate cyclase
VIRKADPQILIWALLATLLVVLIDGAGGFVGWNQRMLDLEQAWLPRNAEPMSSDIVMVDIDDWALERLGGWPWPRTAVADALDELHRAGARTVAIDLDFADPRVRDPHEDEALAAALRPSDILGVLLMPDELAHRWASAGGTPEQLEAALAVLRGDLSANPADTMPQAADAIADTLLLLRRQAVFTSAAHATPEELRAAAGPLQGQLEPLITAAHRQQHGRRALPGTLPGDSQHPGSAGDRFPLATLGEAAGGSGYVHIVRRSRDGGIRHMVPTQPVGDGRIVPSLGVAAAMHHLGTAGQLDVSPDMVVIGDVEVPLSDGAMTVCWPRGDMGMEWPDLHRRHADDPRFAGHLSIGEIVELARARRELESQQAARAEITRSVLQVVRGGDVPEVTDWSDPGLLDEVRGELEFSLDGITDRASLDAATDGLDDATIAAYTQMFNWRLLDEDIAAIATGIEASEATLTAAVEGRLVFIGWTATGTIADFVPTAAGPRTPGVMVHAAVADMILQNRVLREGPRWWSPASAAILGLIVALLVAALGPWPGTAAAIIVLGAWTGLLVLLFGRFGLVLPAASPLVAITLSWASGTSVRAVLVQREKHRVTRQFRARVPAALVDELARDPDALSMRGVRREVCVMFGDLAGFTGISERLGPEETVGLLNRCMVGLTECVTDQKAYLNKFLGDGFLAFWSAFGEQPDQGTLAIRAALDCQAFMSRINTRLEDHLPRVGLRIGIATGEALVGDCGAPPNLNDYTVIGDVANLAARLESANKQLGTSILVDNRTCRAAGETVPLIEVGPLQVVGRDGVVNVWTTPDEGSSAEGASALAAAIRAGDRAAAELALATLEAPPGPTALTQRLATLVRGAADPFPTAIRLIEK